MPRPERLSGSVILLAVVTAVSLGAAIGFDASGAAVLFGALLIGLVYLLVLLRHPQRSLWLLAVGLPYERLGTLPFGFFTLKFGHVVTAAALLSIGARAAITRTLTLAPDPLRLPLVFLLFASVLSLISAPDVVRGAALIAQLVVGFAVYWVTIHLFGRANARPTLIALWAGAVLVSAFGIYQFVGDYLGLPPEVTGLVPSYSGSAAFGFARITGPSLEPLYFANYLLLPLLTAMAVAVGLRGRARLWLAPVVAAVGVAFVLTLARGAYLGLAAGLLLILARYWRQVFQPKVLASLSLVIGIVGTLVVWLLLASAHGAESPLSAFRRQLEVTGTDVSSQQRVGTVQAAADLVREHPLIGVGVGNFGQYYQDPRSRVGDESVPQTVHNQPFETLVETGLLGLAALVWLGAVLVRRTARAWRAARGAFPTALLVGTAAAALAIVVQAQTFSALYLMHVWFALGLLVGAQNLILTRGRI